MLFIGIALLAAVGLALLISADAGSLVGLTQEQTGQLVPLLAILIVIAGGMFARKVKFSQMASSLLLWVGIFGLAFVGYTYRADLTAMAGRVLGELAPGVAVVDPRGGTAEFRRGLGGHFPINARVNKAEIRLIFDTGASAVVLTNADARKAGINTEVLEYRVAVSTANGTGRAAAVTLDEIDVGGIVRNNVRAFIAEEGALETSLLGMTFLETLSRYAVTNNALELTD